MILQALFASAAPPPAVGAVPVEAYVTILSLLITTAAGTLVSIVGTAFNYLKARDALRQGVRNADSLAGIELKVDGNLDKFIALAEANGIHIGVVRANAANAAAAAADAAAAAAAAGKTELAANTAATADNTAATRAGTAGARP